MIQVWLYILRLSFTQLLNPPSISNDNAIFELFEESFEKSQLLCFTFLNLINFLSHFLLYILNFGVVRVKQLYILIKKDFLLLEEDFGDLFCVSLMTFLIIEARGTDSYGTIIAVVHLLERMPLTFVFFLQ